MQLGRVLGEAYGVEVMHFWQPETFSKVPNKYDDELWERIGFDPQKAPAARRRYDEVRKRSGVDPIDLSRRLDNLDRPVYFDAGHTNEFGAKTVAKAMYAKLRPQLLKLTRSGN